jgi:hypothetical protein
LDEFYITNHSKVCDVSEPRNTKVTDDKGRHDREAWYSVYPTKISNNPDLSHCCMIFFIKLL